MKRRNTRILYAIDQRHINTQRNTTKPRTGQISKQGNRSTNHFETIEPEPAAVIWQRVKVKDQIKPTIDAETVQHGANFVGFCVVGVGLVCSIIIGVVVGLLRLLTAGLFIRSTATDGATPADLINVNTTINVDSTTGANVNTIINVNQK